MPQPFYHYEEDYNGSFIHIQVERDTGTHDFGDGDVITLHTITVDVDDVDLTELTQDNPTDAHPPVYDSIANKLSEILTAVKADIDAIDELDAIMIELGYTGGSETIEGFIATAGTPTFVNLAWTADGDIANIEIESDTLSDFSTSTLEDSGAISPPQTYGPYTSGVTMYFRIRGQRTGEDFGPWSTDSEIVP